MLKTWIICIIIAIALPNPGLGGPVPEPQKIPNTTLDVVLQKFPSLDKSKLDPNLIDVLNKTCADWQAINSTSSVTRPGDRNAQCLVLYESLATFCLKFGESLPKYLGYIPSLVPKNLNVTIQNICSDTDGLYSLKDAEHNISNILQPETKPINCYLLCSGFGYKGATIIHDTCKYSYFFTSFEASKFLGDINARLNSTVSQNKIEPQPVKAEVPETAQENQVVQTTKQTVKVDINAQAVKEDQKNAEVKVEAPAKSKNINDVLEEVAGKPDVSPENVNPVAENPDSLAEKPDKIADAQIPAAVAEPPAAVAENPLEAEEKKNIPAPKVPSNKNELPADAANNNSLESNANQDDMENEEAEEAALAQEEANGKAEPVMPEEIAEIKTPSIKGKPNTVEDDPVSSYNIPEDDMDGDSYFFSYFTVLMCLVIVGYVGYHNRQKILALVLEGKRGKRTGRQARRPNSSNYHKLDSNLEEAISSSCTKNASNVIY